MNPVLWFYTILYIGSLLLLFYITRKKRSYYAVGKALCSLLFCGCAVLAYGTGTGGRPVAFAFLLAALLCCAAGDVLLGLANKTKKVRARPFVAGALCFSVAHVLFCLFYYRFSPFHWYDALVPAALAGAVWLLERSERVKLRNIRALVYLYSLLVGLMTTKAVQAGIALQASPAVAVLTALGAICFLLSDLILLFLYFGQTRHKWIRAANLASYYGGIYLIALTAHWL